MERDTVEVYERGARAWRDARPPAKTDEAEALRARTPSGTVTVDLGCGPGGYLEHLARPTVAFDASGAMLDLAREAAADAWPVRGDLEALPFRRGSFGAAWAQASYLHVRPERLPLALADLHHALVVGGAATLALLAGPRNGPRPDDDFPGRWFAAWTLDALRDVLVGAGFEVQALATDDEWLVARVGRTRTLPDTVGPGMRLLVCGLNPSERAADAGVGFVTPGNRFWPAAIAAGLVSVDRDARAALARGIGMTDLVKRATPRADELTRDEYRIGLGRVERLVRWLRPAAVCFVGLAGWRAAVSRRAVAGPQPDGLGDRPVYVMPSTSGLNARTPPGELADHLRAAAALADAAEPFGVSRAPS
jgi:TDG/mug DNA glycosylase family protein